ncbi:MAG TPA: phosphoribosylformylglycinamidine synthase subunit PurS [Gemmatimonadales bacterium]|nr:phosphoribosylformylglycinamidine synthase subunit PurS [Gemmatimonadales bacterium]
MTFHVHVQVMPRAGLLDPQGQAVETALHALGFGGASEVRIGRSITFGLRAASAEDATTKARQMCDKLLANPVTEDFELRVEEA